VEPDEAGVKYVIDFIGADRLVFSTHYPHGDSKYPHAVESFFGLKITDEGKRKILRDNCPEFYHVS
jgi:predicted TIM-barrel fold metal-dependent hydrolase